VEILINKGNWVRIHEIILQPEERAKNIPDDTSKVPYEMWVKGYLTENAEIGDSVCVKTITGRFVEGNLIEKDPSFDHSYGKFVPELLKIGPQLRRIIFGGEFDE
jgi:hypothetical protein